MTKFKEAVSYFEAFRSSRAEHYTAAMREYNDGPNSGYGEFPGFHFVINTIRNICGSLFEIYADLSIPSGRFVTEQKLIESWQHFQRQLDGWLNKLDDLQPDIIAHFRSKTFQGDAEFSDKDLLPEPFTEVGNICAEVRDAVAHTLSIVEEREDQSSKTTVDRRLARIFGRFHRVAVQLRQRRVGRPPLTINDEYDVQYLMHALLRIEFDDIRPEEYTPSYAGASARIDFLLPIESVAVEIKMTRATLKEKELGEELIVDAARYASHSNVSKLYCFVYDPSELLSNPDGLIKDLEKLQSALVVKVTIVPER